LIFFCDGRGCAEKLFRLREETGWGVGSVPRLLLSRSSPILAAAAVTSLGKMNIPLIEPVVIVPATQSPHANAIIRV